jgi:hypothetical protein
MVNPFSESDSSAPRDIPPLTIMSINARTIINHTMNTQEILAISTAVWEDCQSDLSSRFKSQQIAEGSLKQTTSMILRRSRS